MQKQKHWILEYEKYPNGGRVYRSIPPGITLERELKHEQYQENNAVYIPPEDEDNRFNYLILLG